MSPQMGRLDLTSGSWSNVPNVVRRGARCSTCDISRQWCALVAGLHLAVGGSCPALVSPCRHVARGPLLLRLQLRFTRACMMEFMRLLPPFVSRARRTRSSGPIPFRASISILWYRGRIPGCCLYLHAAAVNEPQLDEARCLRLAARPSSTSVGVEPSSPSLFGMYAPIAPRKDSASSSSFSRFACSAFGVRPASWGAPSDRQLRVQLVE